MTIPQKWKTTALKDIVNIVIDNRGRNPEYYVQQGIPVIDNVLIKGERKIELDKTRRFIDENTYSSFIRKYNQENDVLITLVGNGYGNVALSPKAKSIIMQNTVGLRCNDLGDNIFLFYNLSLNKRSLTDLNIGAAQPSIKVGDLLDVELILPPLPEQRAIAVVLSSLDDKIELLREQNKTLESTTQAIFKEWFVNFNFPDKDSKPHKANGGKMIDSELSEIPERWRVGKLTEVFDFMEGPGIRNWQYTDAGRKFMNIRLIQNGDIDIKNANHISIEEAEGAYRHFHLQEKDMVVSTSGTLGRSAIVRKEHLPLMLNTSVIRFRPIDGFSYGFMYQFLNSPFFQNELESMASGSVQLNFGPTHLKQIVMIIPPKNLLSKFSLAINPLYEKMIFILSQIEALSTFRDTLLPELMKGGIRVKGFKK